MWAWRPSLRTSNVCGDVQHLMRHEGLGSGWASSFGLRLPESAASKPQGSPSPVPSVASSRVVRVPMSVWRRFVRLLLAVKDLPSTVPSRRVRSRSSPKALASTEARQGLCAFRPRGFSPPRRLAPRRDLWACCIPLPVLGFTGLCSLLDRPVGSAKAPRLPCATPFSGFPPNFSASWRHRQPLPPRRSHVTPWSTSRPSSEAGSVASHAVSDALGPFRSWASQCEALLPLPRQLPGRHHHTLLFRPTEVVLNRAKVAPGSAVVLPRRQALRQPVCRRPSVVPCFETRVRPRPARAMRREQCPREGSPCRTVRFGFFCVQPSRRTALVAHQSSTFDACPLPAQARFGFCRGRVLRALQRPLAMSSPKGVHRPGCPWKPLALRCDERLGCRVTTGARADRRGSCQARVAGPHPRPAEAVRAAAIRGRSVCPPCHGVAPARHVCARCLALLQREESS